MKYLLIFIIYFLTLTAISANASRIKRRVVFKKNSKFFLRLNGKEPILPFTKIFSHGWGFKVNWELPDSIQKLHKLFRRDVNNDIQEYLKQPELKDHLCILRYFARALVSFEAGEYCGVFCKLSDIINRSDGDDTKFYNSIFKIIHDYDGNCPDVHYELMPFTDV